MGAARLSRGTANAEQLMETPVVKDMRLELFDAQRRLQAVLDNATVSIFLMDDRQKCIYMNKAAEDLTGFMLDEILALDKPLHDIIHHTHPDGSHFALQDCAIDRAFPERNKMQGEEIFVHKDGSFYPVAFTASPIRDEALETIGTIIEVRAIREEQAARERQGLLVNELNHRVKNTLATVQALAHQTLKDDRPGAAERFNGRITALSSAHDVLTQFDWKLASIPQIVDRAMRPFSFGERIHRNGPDCGVTPKAAVTLSMVLHELATNALKYGSLSANGEVHVEWSCQHERDGTVIDFVWTESGGPKVEAPTRRGFGSRLIERQLKLEFDGQSLLDFQPDGLICRLHFKMPLEVHEV
jgi:PAS domain S-box-containing protein